MDTGARDGVETLDAPSRGESASRRRRALSNERLIAWVLGVGAVLLVWWVNRGQTAGSPDSVTYISAADSLRDGTGLGSWLESPLSTFPPGWPLLIAGTPLGTEWAAFLWIAVSLLAIPHLVLSIMARISASVPARVLAMVAVVVSPTLVPWGYAGLSEVPFTALVLLAVALALASTADRRLLWAAAVVAGTAPVIRYAGVAVPVALGGWVALDRHRARRWLTGAAVAAIGLVPLGVVVIVNLAMTGSAMGGRMDSLIGPVQVTQQALATLGRTALWTLDSVPSGIAVVLSLGVLAVVGVSLLGPRTSADDDGRRDRMLLGLMAALETVVLIAARSRVEMDALDGRLLATTAVLVLLLAFALLGDLTVDAGRNLRLVLLGGAAAWCLVGVGALARGALGQDNGYDGTAFTEARALPALDQVPAACRRLSVRDLEEGALPNCGVLADEPWAWYRSDIRPLSTPRRGGGADGDLARLRRAVEDGSDIYVAWTTVNEPYGSLVQLDGLRREFRMEELGSGEDITLYRITGTR